MIIKEILIGQVEIQGLHNAESEAFGDCPYLSLPALEAKRDAFLRATGEYAGWTLTSQGLSLGDM